MNDLPHGSPDPARHKAVLAAILAVQRGHLAPEEAVRVLAELPPGHEPMQTLLQLAPANVRTGLKVEAEALAENPNLAAQTLASFGISSQDASSLLMGSDTAKTVKETLLTVAGSRPPTDRVTEAISRLPKAGDSGRYTVKSEFARGGMGRVLLALDNAVGREVAMKELLPNALGSSSLPASAKDASRGELVERFLREAKVTGQLEHPNIVPVYEIGSREDGRVFYTMKLVRGKTMAHRLKSIQNDDSLDARGKLAERLKLLDAFHDVCNAVAYAHSRNVIHRDLKPANIMLGEYGETLVLDWGLARVQGQEDRVTKGKTGKLPDMSPSLLQEGSDARTLDGAVLGTPAYMPPEQARGDLSHVDERSDVYALGAMLYEILSGRAPYEGPTAQTVLAKVLVLEPDDLAVLAPEAPRELVVLAKKAMDRARGTRLASAGLMASEIAAYRDGRALSVYRYSTGESIARFVRRNRTAVAVASVALLLLVAGGVYSFVSITAQRDQARDSLAQATEEREARLALEQNQARERAKLVAERRQRIHNARKWIDVMQPAASVSAASDHLARLNAEPRLAMDPAHREQAAAAVTQLLEVVRTHEDLLRLLTEPIAGRTEELATESELSQLQQSIREERLLAVRLATRNQDFALAAFVVEGTKLNHEDRTAQLAAITNARDSQLLSHRATIERSLADMRADLGRMGHKSLLPRLEDYVLTLSGYREPQTVDLLGAALKSMTDKARAAGTEVIWTQSERDEITLCCRVLAALELPTLAIPHMAGFLAIITDDRLAIECATALCMTAHEAAYAPLVEARARLGREGWVWSRVQYFFHRVPEPAGLPTLTTAADLLDRANLRREQRLDDLAAKDIDAALELEPQNIRALVAKGTTLKGVDALEYFDRALQLDAGYASAWRERSMAHWFMGERDKAVNDIERSLALDPDNSTALHRYGFYLDVLGRTDEAIAATERALKQRPFSAPTWANLAAALVKKELYDRALTACNRAIELDPRQHEAWINRGLIKHKLGDSDGALADLTRLLEIAPGHPWAFINRGMIRKDLGDLKGAIYDFTETLNRQAAMLPQAGFLRGQCYRQLGRFDEALADLKLYRDRTTDAQTRAEVEKEIAEVEALKAEKK